MIRIGLSGGIGTGKTTVLAMFKKLGITTLSADAVVSAELKSNRRLKAKIRRAFGPGVFRKGAVDKRALAQAAFSGAKDVKKLNALVHPLVKTRIFEFFRKHKKGSRKALAVVEVPLLFETGFDRFFDTTVVVSATSRVQKERFSQRPRFGPEDFRRRLRWQLPLAEKRMRCDFVIDNNGDRRKTFDQVKKIVDFLIGGSSKEEKTWKRKK